MLWIAGRNQEQLADFTPVSKPKGMREMISASARDRGPLVEHKLQPRCLPRPRVGLAPHNGSTDIEGVLKICLHRTCQANSSSKAFASLRSRV